VFPGSQQTPVDRRVVVLLNDGTGALLLSKEYTIANGPWRYPYGSLHVGDLNGDLDLDIAAVGGPEDVPGTLAVFMNNGNGTFYAAQTMETQINPLAVVLVDFDGDTDLDAVVTRNGLVVEESPVMMRYFNMGGGSFSLLEACADPLASTFTPAIGDLDGNGVEELVIPNDFGTVQTHVGSTAYGFACTSYHSGAGDRTWRAAIADLDRDGAADVITANNADGNISVLRNVGCASQPCPADCDGSGSLDLFDFLCFVNAYTNGEPAADCDGDGGLTLFDFLCFVNAFNAGCA
jgi:hypothetical protein